MEEGSSDDDDFMEQEARLLQEAEFEPVKRVIWLSNGKIDIKADFMLLACHKKSYLICDKITNFRIFMQPIPNLFSKYKTETAKTGLRQLLENI